MFTLLCESLLAKHFGAYLVVYGIISGTMPLKGKKEAITTLRCRLRDEPSDDVQSEGLNEEINVHIDPEENPPLNRSRDQGSQ